MIQKIMACTATNSGAVDSDGQLWLWGAQRHGLLGMPQEANQTYPKPLTLTIGSATEIEMSQRDAFQPDDEVTLRVTEIAIG